MVPEDGWSECAHSWPKAGAKPRPGKCDVVIFTQRESVGSDAECVLDLIAQNDRSRPKMEVPMNVTEALARLNDSYEFPTDFVFKVIGRSASRFEEEVREVCNKRGGSKAWSCRESKGGKHRALTFTLFVDSADDVLTIWSELRACDGTHMLL